MADSGLLTGGARRGTTLALGIVLLWVAGMLLFVAFMSGKVASLTQGTDGSGKSVGPTDLPSLLVRIANNAQSLQGDKASGGTTG